MAKSELSVVSAAYFLEEKVIFFIVLLHFFIIFIYYSLYFCVYLHSTTMSARSHESKVILACNIYFLFNGYIPRFFNA